jgi:hypothetical protein
MQFVHNRWQLNPNSETEVGVVAEHWKHWIQTPVSVKWHQNLQLMCASQRKDSSEWPSPQVTKQMAQPTPAASGLHVRHEEGPY